jgi:hypothetical protein
MKLIYACNEKNIIFGKFENLLNSVKSFSDIKIGLGSKKGYEEIIPFVNIAYTDDYVVGIQPYHTSSQSLSSFQNNQLINYKNFNMFFLYYSNMNYGKLRSSQNSEVYNEVVYRKSDYKYFNWHERNLDNKFRYNSIKDENDIKKTEKLIDGIRKGYNLKIRFSLNGVKYIFTPTIKYFNFGNNPNSLSIKTHPIIDISEIEKNRRFVLKECLININGNVSILQSNEFFLTKKSFFFERLFKFFLRKLNINFQLKRKNKLKHQNFQKQDIDWYLY